MDDISIWSNDSLIGLKTSRPGLRHRLRIVQSSRRAGKRVMEELKGLVNIKALFSALWELLKSQGSELMKDLKAIRNLPRGSGAQATATWKLIGKVVVKIAKVLRWVLENMNFRFDHNLARDNIEKLSDEELLRKQNSTIRGISGSITGALLSGAITVACHIFAVPLAVNCWQLVVSIVNHARVSREMKRRGRSLEETEKWFHRLVVNRPETHVVLGCVVKIGLMAAGIGIIGVDNILDSFEAQFGSATSSAAHVAAIAKSTLPVPSHAAALHPPSSGDGIGAGPHGKWEALHSQSDEELCEHVSRADNLKIEHPKLYKFADVMGKIFCPGQLADEHISEGVAHLKAEHAMHTSTPGREMEEMVHHAGIPASRVFGTATSIGAVNEVCQPLLHATEITANKLIDKKRN